MEISGFPLAWRWTDEKHAVLPDTVLANIIPQERKVAEELFNLSLGFLGQDGLAENQFRIKQIKAEAADVKNIRAWLLNCHHNEETKIFLSWQPDTAVVTTWGIFVRYWTEFCYPASDDLLVWSEYEN